MLDKLKFSSLLAIIFNLNWGAGQLFAVKKEPTVTKYVTAVSLFWFQTVNPEK